METDLHSLPLNTKLTEHFTLGEMVASQTAARNDLDNYPDYERFGNGVEFARVLLEPLREVFGPVYSSSWNRSPIVNKKIGGSKTSAHMHCVAMDHTTQASLYAEMDWWIGGDLPYDQVIYEFGRWIHVGWKTPDHPVPRRQALMAFLEETDEIDPKTGKKKKKTKYYPYNPSLIDESGTELK